MRTPTPSRATGDREVDIALYGATGFVGQLLARYLAEHAPADLRIALAGRSKERLEAVRAQLGTAAASWPVIVADSSHPKSLTKLAAAAGVVVTTVGPYRKHGIELVGACAEAGTHYADLTGEVLFMRESIDRYHDVAVRSGARIVHACGFDSIPSDLGTMLLHDAVQADRAGKLTHTTLVVKALKGGLSGGTIASMKEQLAELRAKPELRRVVGDPYALSPERTEEPHLGSERDLQKPTFDKELGIWLGPFVMASTNSRVVRRSNALLGWAYGRRFQYREVMGFGAGATAPLKAGALTGALAAFAGAMSFGPTRGALDRVLPKPGGGPSPETQRNGFFAIDIHTRTTSHARYVAHVAAGGDPGYAATSVMLGEAALCLALDRDRLPDRAGVLTPATAMGTVLVDRLRAAGHTYTVAPATA